MRAAAEAMAHRGLRVLAAAAAAAGGLTMTIGGLGTSSTARAVDLALAELPDDLRTQIARVDVSYGQLLGSAPGGGSGAWVFDTGAGRVISSIRSEQRRSPASVEKLLTAAAALGGHAGLVRDLRARGFPWGSVLPAAAIAE